MNEWLYFAPVVSTTNEDDLYLVYLVLRYISCRFVFNKIQPLLLIDGRRIIIIIYRSRIKK